MQKIVLFCLIFINPFCQPLFARDVPASKRFRVSNHILRQAKCEDRDVRVLKAKEVADGPLYEKLREVAAAFGRRNVPHLYLVPGEGNAVYILGSVFTDGRGKILITETCVRLYGPTESLRGFLAHEMAHLAADDGSLTCYDRILRNPALEEAADALAAKTVGYEAVRAFILKSEELLETKYGEMALRLKVLERAQKGR